MNNHHPVSHNKNGPPRSNPLYYAIRIKGLLDTNRDWLRNLTVTHLEQGETLLRGPIPDQAALHGLLARIRDLNLTLLAVYLIGPEDR